MTRVLPLIVLLVITTLAARAGLLLQPNDHVALCGDGLADTGCSVYLEDYLMMAEPALRSMDIEQFGWAGGDPVVLPTKLLPFKPTVAILYFGSGDPATREKAMTDLVDALKKAGVRLVVIGSPPAVDAATFQGDAAEADSENQHRAALAAIDRKVAAAQGAVYADVFGTVQAALAKAKSLQGADYVKQARFDDAMHFAMAQAFIEALGFDGNIGTVTIDYAANKAEGSPGQKIDANPDHSFAITSTSYPFWFPGHGVGGSDPPPWPAMEFLTFDQDLNRYTLVVKNLPTAQTKIYWGDLNQDFSSDELSRGVNLMIAMRAWNPFGNIDSGIDNGAGGQQQTERILGDAASKGTPDPQAETKHEAAMQVTRSRAAGLPIKLIVQLLAPVAKQPPGPIPVILDTDLDGDVDDVGALALLNDFMDQGEAKLLAVVHDTVNATQSSCATIHAIDAWYGHADVPIGQYLGEHPAKIDSKVDPAPPGPGAYHDPAAVSGSGYTQQIQKRFEPNFPGDDKMAAGVDVYRKALASAEDGTVVVVSVGLMENIQDLLLSRPDAVSPLNGLDLVKKKVRQLVVMSNTQPADQYLLGKWPTPIIWTTYVGSGIGTGPSLIPTPENNPVRVAYDLFGVLHNGRQSWDLTASWLAVRGPGNMFDLVSGRPQYIIDITKSPAGPYPNEHEATIKMPYDQASKVIGEELARPPKY